jgi:hypothetical protein
VGGTIRNRAAAVGTDGTLLSPWPAPYVPPAPAPAPSTPATTPNQTPAVVPVAPARLASTVRRRGNTVVTTGPVPMGATSVVQVASSGRSRATASVFGMRQSARTVTRCPITTTSRTRTYTCRVRLRTGTWTLTTRAKAGSVVVAQSVSRVRVTAKAPQRVPVTG